MAKKIATKTRGRKPAKQSALTEAGKLALERTIQEGYGVSTPKPAGRLATEMRFQSRFPIQIHDSADLFGVSRFAIADIEGHASKFDLVGWFDSPTWWWLIATEALKAGQRISMAIPVAYAADIAALGARKLDVPVRAIYDVEAGRLVFVHDKEEEIKEAILNAEES